MATHIKLPHGVGVCWLLLACVLLCAGCAQRVGAVVSAVAEEGYTAAGQAYSLSVLGGLPEEERALLPSLAEQLRGPLADMGYGAEASSGEAPVRIRLYWYATGPHTVYRTEWTERDFGRRYPWRRRTVAVAEDVYDRYLVIEALYDPRRNSVQSTPQTPEEALHTLPAPPGRLLWRVMVTSRGNLARVRRVLPEMVAAALPWMGKAGQARVVVQGDAVMVQGK